MPFLLVEKQHPHGKGTDAARGFSSGWLDAQEDLIVPALTDCWGEEYEYFTEI